jgi:hypothetical protein
MPRPTSSTTIQRPDLGALAYEYTINAPNAGFIGTEIFPIFETPEQASDYPIIPIESLLKLPPDLRRQARGSYVRDDFQFETNTYSCAEYGLESPVDDTEAALYDRFFDVEAVATERANNMLLRDLEVRIAAQAFSTSVVTNTGAVSIEWSTLATCTPYDDIVDARRTLQAATGVTINAAAMCKKVFDNVVRSAEIQGLLQYTNPVQTLGMQAKMELMRQYFELDYLLVSEAVRDTAGKGLPFSLSNIWDDEYVLLFRKPANARNLKEPSLGRTFLWTADSPQIITTDQYREEQTRSNVYRVRHYVGESLVCAGAGYLLSNITA